MGDVIERSRVVGSLDDLERTLGSTRRMKTLMVREITEAAEAFGDDRRSILAARDEARAQKAKGAKKGVWSGTFIKPWDWRKGKRLKPSKVSTCCKRCRKNSKDWMNKKSKKSKKDRSCKSACSKKSSVCEKP